MEEKKPETNAPSAAEDEKAEKEYPPTKIVVPAMLAIYLAVFLVALVSRPQIARELYVTTCEGQNNYRNRDTHNYETIQLIRRCRMVRSRLPPTAMCLAINLRTNLQVLLYEVAPSRPCRPL
jgi:hypothetical protein